MPEDRTFLDTNILIYAFDLSAGTKHEKAKRMVVDLWESGFGILSTQVLQEFFVTITQKIIKPVGIREAKEIVRDFLKWDVIVNDGELILAAIDLQGRYHYSFWDSMIIAAAIEGEAFQLISEDLSHGQKIEGVQIKNPFR